MGIGFGLVWLILFLLRKDIRKEMLVISVIFGILGPISNILFIQDWWSPLTFDGTKVGILDSIFVGFMIGGVTAVLYEEIFRRVQRRDKRLLRKKEHLLFFLMFPIALIIFFGGFYLLDLNSWIASTLALFVPAVVILTRRSDLLIEAFVSGVLLVVVATAVYNFVELFTPGWIQTFWYFKNVPPIIVLNMPIDDAVHYFFLGMFGGPLYEYWQGVRLVKKVV